MADPHFTLYVAPPARLSWRDEASAPTVPLFACVVAGEGWLWP